MPKTSGSCLDSHCSPYQVHESSPKGNLLYLALLTSALHVRHSGNAWEPGKRLLDSLALGKIKPLSIEGPVLQVCREGPAPPSLHLFTRHLSLGSGEPGGWIRWVSALIDSDTSFRAPSCPPPLPLFLSCLTRAPSCSREQWMPSNLLTRKLFSWV